MFHRLFHIAICLAIGISLSGSVLAAETEPVPGFALPKPGHVFEFPRDHGSHPEFKIEWWYVTGHLFDAQSHRYGFQATFFRRASLPPGLRVKEESYRGTEAFKLDPIHLAHVAITDEHNQRFTYRERLHREGWNARASSDGLDVFNGNWSLVMTNTATSGMTLQGSSSDGYRFQLALQPVKPLVIFGVDGVSRKGDEPSAASHYLTFSRLTVAGQLNTPQGPAQVRGEAWMDHEISSSQLGRDQTGWDWVGAQLSNGCEVMAYRLRRRDGSTDPASTLAWIDRTGAVQHLVATQFEWRAQRTWRSPRTGVEYPVEAELRFQHPETRQAVRLVLKPLIDDQEIQGKASGVAYWEGASRVTLKMEGAADVEGSAYLELAGYKEGLRERLQ